MFSENPRVKYLFYYALGQIKQEKKSIMKKRRIERLLQCRELEKQRSSKNCKELQCKSLDDSTSIKSENDRFQKLEKQLESLRFSFDNLNSCSGEAFIAAKNFSEKHQMFESKKEIDRLKFSLKSEMRHQIAAQSSRLDDLEKKQARCLVQSSKESLVTLTPSDHLKHDNYRLLMSKVNKLVQNMKQTNYKAIKNPEQVNLNEVQVARSYIKSNATLLASQFSMKPPQAVAPNADVEKNEVEEKKRKIKQVESKKIERRMMKRERLRQIKKNLERLRQSKKKRTKNKTNFATEKKGVGVQVQAELQKNNHHGCQTENVILTNRLAGPDAPIEILLKQVEILPKQIKQQENEINATKYSDISSVALNDMCLAASKVKLSSPPPFNGTRCERKSFILDSGGADIEKHLKSSQDRDLLLEHDADTSLAEKDDTKAEQLTDQNVASNDVSGKVDEIEEDDTKVERLSDQNVVSIAVSGNVHDTDASHKNGRNQVFNDLSDLNSLEQKLEIMLQTLQVHETPPKDVSLELPKKVLKDDKSEKSESCGNLSTLIMSRVSSPSSSHLKSGLTLTEITYNDSTNVDFECDVKDIKSRQSFSATSPLINLTTDTNKSDFELRTSTFSEIDFSQASKDINRNEVSCKLLKEKSKQDLIEKRKRMKAYDLKNRKKFMTPLFMDSSLTTTCSSNSVKSSQKKYIDSTLSSTSKSYLQ